MNKAEWLEGHADRRAGRQRAAVDSAKLIATFAAGVAAAFAGTEFQIASSNVTILDWITGGIVLISLLMAIVVVQSDRLIDADEDAVLLEQANKGWSDDETIAELRTKHGAAVDFNELVIARQKNLLNIQLMASVVCSTAALGGILLSVGR